jgi:uncharacterized phage protein (TIGR01671 family)
VGFERMDGGDEMREYKFRGKRVDNGEWVYGYYDGCYDTATINYLKDGIPYNACVISETVGQYTGLHDKSGKEIYEGDIVIAERPTWSYELYNHNPSGHDGCVCVQFQGIVVFANGCFEIQWLKSTQPETYYYKEQAEWCDINARYVSYRLASNIVVIGNIYSNPELLEESV